jgi:hypothetical protein
MISKLPSAEEGATGAGGGDRQRQALLATSRPSTGRNPVGARWDREVFSKQVNQPKSRIVSSRRIVLQTSCLHFPSVVFFLFPGLLDPLLGSP